MNCDHFIGTGGVFSEHHISTINENLKYIHESQVLLFENGFTKKKPLSMREIIDGRKGYIDRFKFCPKCGEKINWKEIISNIGS